MRLGVDQLTRSILDGWQLERLREVVAWVRERSPFYQRLYAGLPAGFPDALSDLAALPFVESRDFREHGLEFVCVSQGDIARVVTVPTSGSTGAPKRLWFSDEDLELTIDHFRHGMRALVRAGQRVLVLMPGDTPGSVGSLLKEALARDGVQAESYGFVDSCEQVATKILKYEADCLVGVPGQVLRLARSRSGRAIPPRRLKTVLLSGDHVARSLRRTIEQSWRCRVFEHYGSTEIGLGGAVQCRALTGLHIREADLFFEVVDPGSGRSLPDGEEGELVVTTLTRRGMPLIRLRTGDLGRMSSHDCECGSVLSCIERVGGRVQDVTDLGGGELLTLGELDEVVYSQDWVMGFGAEVGGSGGQERLILKVETEGSPTPANLAALAEGIAAIEAVRNRGVVVDLELLPEGSGPLGGAKRRILDSRTVNPSS